MWNSKSAEKVSESQRKEWNEESEVKEGEGVVEKIVNQGIKMRKGITTRRAIRK